jgi:sporulation protein YlmC with PRC-barrel domain
MRTVLTMAVALFAAGAIAQELEKPSDQRAAGRQSASDLIGTDVYTFEGDEAGEISDLIIEGSEVVAVELSVGGLLGLGAEKRIVPFSEIQIADGRMRIAAAALDESAAEGGAFTAERAGERPRAEPDAPETVREPPEQLAPLPIDSDLAEIDPRLAEGIAANEEAYDEEVDHDSFRYDEDGHDSSDVSVPQVEQPAAER